MDRTPPRVGARALWIGLALALLRPSAAAAEPSPAPAAEAAPPRAPLKTVGLLRLGGPSDADSLRWRLKEALTDGGYAVKTLAMDLTRAATWARCKLAEPRCLPRIAAELRRELGIDVFVYGVLAAPDSGDRSIVSIVSTDPSASKGSTASGEWLAPLAVLEATPTSDDFILPFVYPIAIATAIHAIDHPTPPITEAEAKILAGLDHEHERPDTFEECDDCGWHPPPRGDPRVPLELGRVWKYYCRTKPRGSGTEPGRLRDPLPYCRYGPFWGYFRIRSWIALGFTSAGVVATATAYGLGLASLGRYRSDAAALDASGLDPTDPLDHDAYTARASAVAAEGDAARRALIAGDVALGATIVSVGVLALLHALDRRDAKRHIRRLEALRFIAGPGFGVELRF
ncbi:MAG: hypothetical protein R3B09_01305 [Nannocystaceae bacterium]